MPGGVSFLPNCKREGFSGDADSVLGFAEDADTELNVDKFVTLVQKYTRINCLTPEIVNDFINHIVVHHREKTKSGYVQRVEIYFNFIGDIDLPNYFEQNNYANTFSDKKPLQNKKRLHTDIYNLFLKQTAQKECSQKIHKTIFDSI